MPLPADITHVHRFPHHPLLGRHQVLDARSLNHQPELLAKPAYKRREWAPRIPVLDQSDLHAQGIDLQNLFPDAANADALGSCTGNAATAALSALLDERALTTAGLSTTSAVDAEEWAIRLYAQATAVDEWAGQQFPPDDTGSSGLGVAKALHARGLIGSYIHATSSGAICAVLQNGAAILGMPWREAFFTPDAHGFIDSGDWAASPLAGGHEVAVIGLESVKQDCRGRINPAKTVIRCRNSWTSSWGPLGGDFLLRLSTYEQLRHDCDVIQFRA